MYSHCQGQERVGEHVLKNTYLIPFSLLCFSVTLCRKFEGETGEEDATESATLASGPDSGTPSCTCGHFPVCSEEMEWTLENRCNQNMESKLVYCTGWYIIYIPSST